MDLRQTLIDMEHRLAGGSGVEYREHLAEGAVVIVPGQALDKEETIQAMEASPGWDEYSIEAPVLREVGTGVAILSYRFRGRRGDDILYEALMSSTYTCGDDGKWRLLLHQQTPLV
jgi:Domain of unknown function (DUF4440)